MGDSNANVMDKAVEALVAYLEKADEGLAARCGCCCAAQSVGNRRRTCTGAACRAASSLPLLRSMMQRHHNMCT